MNSKERHRVGSQRKEKWGHREAQERGQERRTRTVDAGGEEQRSERLHSPGQRQAQGQEGEGCWPGWRTGLVGLVVTPAKRPIRSSWF